MTAHLIPIYGSSVLAVIVLALFARHNRKTGWQKQSGKFAQWMSEFYAGAYVEGTAKSQSAFRDASTPTIPAWTPLTDAEVTAFSMQLIQLRTSLGTAGNAPDFQTAPFTHAAVHQRA